MREQFPLLTKHPQLIYLDNSATSQKPQCVLDSLQDFYLTYNSNINRGIYALSQEASKKVDEARSTIAQFFNSTSEHIVFTKNTTESLNLLSRSIPITKEQNIVTTEVEHHSNFVPWQETARRSGAQLRIARYNKETHDIQDLSELVDENTKVVTFTAMSNVSGQIFDVHQIIKNIREKNKDTIIIVDACQWAVHEAIDVQNFDADYLACSIHKMYGPLGVGVLYAKSLEKLDPFLFGGDMITSVSLEGSTYQKGPQKFEAGSIDMAGIVAAATAIEFLSDHREKKVSIEKELTQFTVSKLREIPGIAVVGHNGEKAGSIISFYHEVVGAYDIAQFCANENICIRVGQHCAEPFLKALNVHATCRISLGVYNTKQEIQKAITTITNTVQLITKK